MANFLIAKKQNNKTATKTNVFIGYKLLILSFLISTSYVVATTNGLQNDTSNYKNSINDTANAVETCKSTIIDIYEEEDTVINIDNSEYTLTKYEIINTIYNRLNKIKDIYNTAMLNNVNIPTEMNVSLQIALLDTITLINKNTDNIPFVRLTDLKQQFTDLIEQQDGNKIFVLTSLGFYKQINNIIESDNAIDVKNKLLEFINSYITFKLEYYDSELACIKKFSVTSFEINNENMVNLKNKILEIINKYQQMPKEEQQKHKLKITHEAIFYNGNYFNHKNNTIPHSIALYARIKNNKIDILVFEPAQGIKMDYNNISLIEMIYKAMQQVLNKEIPTSIKFNIYYIALCVQLSGADCITHSYEICKEIHSNITNIDGICDYIDAHTSNKEIYEHILNNIPITFFKTIYQLDFLESIIAVNNTKHNRTNEVSQLKDYLNNYLENEYNIFSTSIYEMGLYKKDKNKFANKFKFTCSEYNNTHNYLGCFTNVNTLIPNSQLQLAKSNIEYLFTDNLIDKLTMNTLSKLYNATEDIDTISNERLNAATEFATTLKTQYNESSNIYYIYILKHLINILMISYNQNIKTLCFDAIKEEMSEVEVFVEINKAQLYHNIGSVTLDLGKYKQQICSIPPETTKRILNILDKKSNSFLDEEDKQQIAAGIQQIKNTIDNSIDDIKNDIQHLFVNNNLDVQITDFYLQTKYNKQINLYFFNLFNSKIKDIMDLLEINNDNFFQEVLKEKSIREYKNYIFQVTN